MRGGDVERTCSAHIHHRIGDDRGGGGAVSQMDLEAVGCQHFGGGSGEEFAVEALVVPDDDPFAFLPFFEQVRGETLGATADVIEGVFFSDDAAPAVCAERDLEGHESPPGIKDDEGIISGRGGGGTIRVPSRSPRYPSGTMPRTKTTCCANPASPCPPQIHRFGEGALAKHPLGGGGAGEATSASPQTPRIPWGRVPRRGSGHVIQLWGSRSIP